MDGLNVPKTFTTRTSRLTAAYTGCAREVSPGLARATNLTIIARRIATLERRKRKLTSDLLACRLALKFARRELRAVAQSIEVISEV